MTATTVVVSSASQLNTAIANAVSGETIELAAGSYSGVKILNKSFSSAIHIESLNNNAPAVLDGLTISGSSGISISHVALSSSGVSLSNYYAFRVLGSSNVAFDSVTCTGDSGNLAKSQMLQQISGIDVSNSNNISVTNSYFAYFMQAITLANSSNITVNHNSFEYNNKGGIEAASIQGAVIDDNTFVNFKSGAGVHEDAIQFFTAGTTTASSNLVISGNLIDRGNGDAVQGIFIQDEVGTLQFKNVTITNNEVIGGAYDSIWVNGATGMVNVSNNVADSWAGNYLNANGAETLTNWSATVMVEGNLKGATVTELGNVSQKYGVASGWVPSLAGNTVTAAVTDQGSSLLHAWAGANPSLVSYLPADFISAAGLSGHSNVGLQHV